MVIKTSTRWEKSAKIVRIAFCGYIFSMLYACNHSKELQSPDKLAHGDSISATESNTDKSSRYKSYKVLKAVNVAEQKIQIYLATDYDVAYVGIAISGLGGKVMYCPLYGSTYEGIPKVTLKASVISTEKELWLESSWKGYRILGMINTGKPVCFTRYGELKFLNKPIPASFGGSRSAFPHFDREKVSKVFTILYPDNN